MDVPEPPLSLSVTPTPIQRLHRLSDEHDAELYVKRDDMTGGVVQGNKVRKLEYLLGDALDTGADTVITTGGVQSNHCRTTAVTARSLGLEPYLLLRGEEPDSIDGNLLLDRLVDAEIEFISAEEYYDDPDAVFERAVERLEDRGRNPYVIPSGGSNGIGILGYVKAYAEIRRDAEAQNIRFDRIYVAVGSAGTYAGLLAGALLAGDDVGIVGVNVTTASVDEHRKRILSNLRECAVESDLPIDIDRARERIEILDGYVGPGYAIPDDADLELIAHVGRSEGLVLDTCYTGKAFRGFLDRIGPAETALFVHTGGSYGIFPVRDRLSGVVSTDSN